MNKPKRALTTVAAAAAIMLLAACGQSGPPERGQLISGANIRATQPPWGPQYTGLARRIRQLGLPTGDSEKFHIHAQLSIYNQGLLVPVPADIGLDGRDHVDSTIHTHDTSGIIHMEAPHPYRYTLGDLFAVWGVRFGAGTLGALQDNGSDRVWVYVNGSRIADPARYVLRNGDDVSIGYGEVNSFPHRPSDYLLKQVLAGKSTLSCAAGGSKKQKSCLSPKAAKKSSAPG